MNDLASFFAGAFLCDCVPHLVCGLKGEPFPTPFARPRGVGESPPLLASWPVAVGINPGLIALLGGALAMGVYLSLHFGKVRSPGRDA